VLKSKTFSPSVSKKIEKRLMELDIEIIKSYVLEIKKNMAILDNNKEVDFDFAIFAGGIKPPPFIQKLNFPKDKKGFLIVDDFLRIRENIFAIGDSIKLTKDNKTIPQTAQSAEISGIYAAFYINSLLLGQPLKKQKNIKIKNPNHFSAF